MQSAIEVIDMSSSAVVASVEEAESAGAANDETADDLRRLKTQEALASAAGITLRDPLYTLGTRVNATGVNNARLFRESFESLPTFAEASEALRLRVTAEKRCDVTVQVSDLMIDPATGRLKRRSRSEQGGLQFSAVGFRQLFSMLRTAPAYAGAYLASVPPDRRAWEASKIFTAEANADQTLVLRVRRPEPEAPAIVYAVVSERYEDFGPLRLLDALETALTSPETREACENLRCEVSYTGPRLDIRLVTHSTLQPERYCAGEVFQACVRFSSGDDKSRGVSASAEAIRNLCLNLICLDRASASLFHQRHVGINGQMREGIISAMSAGISKLQPFLTLWSERRSEPVADVESTVNQLCAVNAVDSADSSATTRSRKSTARISLPSVRPVDMAALVMAAYSLEPEPNVVGIANAVSRVPQVGSFEYPLLTEAALSQTAQSIIATGL